MIHLTLPSNSSLKKFPDNVTAEYTTALIGPLQLEGEWEVGLSEISFPHSFYGTRVTVAGSAASSGDNVDLIVFGGAGPQEGFAISIPPGVYKDGADFMEALETANFGRITVYGFGSLGSYAIKIHDFALPSLAASDYQTVLAGPDPAQPFQPPANIHLTGAGAARLTLEQMIYRRKAGGMSGVFLVIKLKEVSRGSQYDYIDVHCDIIRPTTQGGLLKQIVRRVPVKGVLGDDSLSQTEIFPRVFYFPLYSNTISTIRIGLKDAAGARIPFRSGASSVTLSFRKKVGSL